MRDQLAAVLIVLLAGCGPSPREVAANERASIISRTDSVSALDPQAELQNALKRGDTTFISVGTDSYDVPGVPLRDSLYPAFEATRMIMGTSDAHFDSVGVRFQLVASRYAERYNELLLAELRRRAAQRPAP